MKYQRMKDVAVDVMEIAEESGYTYEFLSERVSEEVRDGSSYEDAVQTVRTISEEKDW